MISRENKKCISKLQKTLYKVELINYNVYVSYKTTQNNTKYYKTWRTQEMKKEIEKLLVRVNWQIESKERSLEQEKEWLVNEAQRENLNCVKRSCERIEQLEKELEIHRGYQYELEGILKMEDEENEITRRN